MNCPSSAAQKRRELVRLQRMLAARPTIDATIETPASAPRAREPIAIVGLHGFLPGAMDVRAFWRMLDDGRSIVREIPAERLAHVAVRRRGSDRAGTWHGGLIPRIDGFDAEFFGLSAGHASLLDPQQRLLLMSVWKAIEDSGHAPSSLRGSATGMFVAFEESDYVRWLEEAGAVDDNILDHHPSIVANRLSHAFDLRGPSEIVNTMCASAAVALHRAVQAIHAGDADQAIVAASKLLLRPDAFVYLSNLELLSPSGTVRSFGADPDGYTRAEGVASIVLKPLARARADRDRVYAIVRQTAVGHHGQAGLSISAPDRDAHASVIERCYTEAGIDPRAVTYIEAQGMGSDLGDVAEWEACNRALERSCRVRGLDYVPGFCRISTLKPQIGHMECASALGALFRIVHALDVGRIPPIVGLTTINPLLDIEGRACQLAQRPIDWEGGPTPRLAGLHAYGSGGNIAHVLVEEHRDHRDRTATAVDGHSLIPLSARTRERLQRQIEVLSDWLAGEPDWPPTLADLAYTLQTGRDEMRWRFAVVADSIADLRVKLRACTGLTRSELIAFGACVADVEEHTDATDGSDGARRRRAIDPPCDTTQETMHEAAARWVRGGRIDWTAFWRDREPRRCTLPTYPFVEERCWFEPPATDAVPISRRDPPHATDVQAYLLAMLRADRRVDQTRLAVDRHFREYGIDSIVGMRLLRGLREELGVTLRPRALAAHPTIAALATAAVNARRACADDDTSANDGSHAPVGPLSHRATAIPLHETQKGLWALLMLESVRGAYHVPLAMRVRGPLDAAALDAAFASVCRRYPVLLARCDQEDGLPVLRVDAPHAPAIQPAVLPEDLTSVGDADVIDALRDRTARAFDLDRGPLVRAYLLRYAPDEHIVLLVVHHLVFDAVSAGLLIDALWQAHADPVRAAATAPAATGVVDARYDEYVQWQQHFLASASGRAARDYWKTALAGHPQTLALPVDRPRAASPTFTGATLEARLSEQATTRLRAFAAGQHLSLCAVLLALYDVVLSRWSGEDDLIVGLPVVVRPESRFDDLFGCFINMMPVRTTLERDESFAHLAARVDALLLDALEHASYPFGHIVRDLSVRSERAVSPVFQVAFTLQNVVSLPVSRRVAGLEVDLLDELRQEGEYDLHLEAIERAETVSLYFKYNPSLFDASTIQRVADAFARAADVALTNGSATVGECRGPFPDETARLLVEWNRTAREIPDVCLHDLFDRQAHSRLDAPAASCGPLTLTYRELQQRSTRLAHHLRQLGVGDESPVGVCMEHSLDLIVALLGVMKAGGAYVPIDPAYPRDRIDYMLADSGARVVLTAVSSHHATSRMTPREGVRALATDCAWADLPTAANAALDHVDPGRLAYVIYTSGSTGRPKGVMVAHHALMNLLVAMRDRLGFAAADRFLALTTHCFDIAALELFLPLIGGGETVLCAAATKRDPHRLRDEIRRVRPAFMQATPASWTALFDSGWRNDERVTALCGGEALPDRLRTAFASTSTRAWNVFGPTETTIWSTMAPILAEGPITIGRPLDNTQLYVLDAQRRPVPLGVPGELHIGGAGVARGYRGRPSLTAERFVPDPFGTGSRLHRTGDRVRWLDSGDVEYLGRLDSQLKIRGFRVDPAEIESTLVMHAGVRQAAVVARRGDIANELVAYVVPAETTIDVASVRAHLRTRLPEYMVPATIHVAPELPLTPNGKVDRQALAARAVVIAPAAAPAASMPRTAEALERTLTRLLHDILGVEHIPLAGNFFDIGVHSLAIVQLMQRLRREHGYDLSTTDVFAHPTVERLAAFLRAAPAVAPAADFLTLQQPAATDTTARYRDTDVAIIGIACRFPMATNARELWDNLRHGRECIRFFTDEELRAAGVTAAELADPRYVKAKGVLDDADRFDASFFHYSPREAEVTDPQHRVFLEVCHAVVEDAGYAVRRYPGHIAIFAGAGLNVYFPYHVAPSQDVAADPFQVLLGNAHDHLSLRVAYKLNLRGPAVTVQTACSTSLVAVHQALECLNSGGADMAIAGGVSIQGGVDHRGYTRLAVLSGDGHCRPFDADADGTVIGQGAGAVLLKKVHDAIRDGDRIYAVIKGTAVNNDGSTKAGYTAPSPDGQERAIALALARAGCSADTIGYVEAHGTGTPLGDPIELRALTAAFRTADAGGGSNGHAATCAIGSVKGNVGHLDAAAGVAGLIKAALCLQHRALVPSVNYRRPNPAIDFGGRFVVNTAHRPWPSDTGPRRAGVSSFGIGGSNAHVVLEEFVSDVAPTVTVADPPGWQTIVPISAATGEALRTSVLRLRELLATTATDAPLSIRDIAYTLQVGRDAMATRLAFVVRDLPALMTAIDRFLRGDAPFDDGVHGPMEAREEPSAVGSEGSADVVRVLVDGWIEAHAWSALAQHWIAGGDVDWTRLYGHALPRRVSLPTYPFARERHWIPASAPVARVQGGQAPQTAVDVEDDVTGTTLVSLEDAPASVGIDHRYTSALSGRERFIVDHVVRGVPVIPGVAHLELARAAAERAAHRKVRALSGIVWPRTAAVDPQPPHLAIDLRKTADGFAAAIGEASGDGSTIYMQGSVAIDDGRPSERPWIDLDAVAARCPRQVDAGAVYEHFERVGLHYGPTFQTVRRLSIGDEEALALLHVVDGADAPTPGVLHPSMMDGALQALVGFGLAAHGQSTAAHVPFSVATVTVFAPTPVRGLAHVRHRSGRDRGGVFVFDVDLADERGNVCVALRELAARALPGSSAVAPHAGVVYATTAWQTASAVPDAQIGRVSPSRPVLLPVLLPRDAVAGAHATSGPMTSIEWIDAASDADAASAAQAWIRAAFGVLKSLMADRRTTTALVVACLREGAPREIGAALGAMFRSAALEHPSVRGRVVWLPAREIAWRRLEAIVSSEATQDPLDVDVRYLDDGARQVRRLIEVPVPPHAATTVSPHDTAGLPAIRDGGVYWISGGSGGLASLFGMHLLRDRRARVILSSRRSRADLPAAIQELLALGAEYIFADVTRRGDVQAVIAQIRERHGRLHGVIHGAGILRDAFILNKTATDLSDVLAPKVLGAVNIDEATHDEPLDFFALFSSVAGALGALGQADYAAANAFLDAFASSRNAAVRRGTRAGRTISFAWPLWADGGMRGDERVVRRHADTLGLLPLDREQGLRAFEAGLRGDGDHLLVFSGHEERLRRALFAPASERERDHDRDLRVPITAPRVDKRAAIAYLKALIASVLKHTTARLADDVWFEQYGLDSLMAIEIIGVLEASFGPLPKTLLFEYQTLDDLAGFFLDRHPDVLARVTAPTASPGEIRVESALAAGAATVEPLNDSIHTIPIEPTAVTAPRAPVALPANSAALEIAIVGLSGRYPQASTLHDFWINLRDGRDCITEIPASRWDHRRYYDPAKGTPGKVYSKWGGFIDGVDCFDPLFFNISPREAEVMDPQERLFLECAWEAIEDAGHTRASLRGASASPHTRVGVFAGTMYAEYQLYGADHAADGHIVALSGTPANIANRVSYFCGFTGPSMTIDTMCSSSLTAIHLACQSLAAGECGAAIAGGVNVTIHPNKYVLLSQGQFISSKGRCESFGEGADGYVPGEGVGCILLKPLARARADADRIYGVIRSTAINHVGKTIGYTVPHPRAQAQVIRDALTRAGIPSRAISYIEAHGTGTTLGDPIEINGLASAFDASGAGQYCAIGSVKSNIGHLEGAAGIAGVTKVLLQLRHRQIVPSLHAETLNPNIDFSRTPFVVQQTLTPWTRPVIGEQGAAREYPRIAGVSAFGAGGSNAHVIIEECVTDDEPTDARVTGESGPAIVPLSARTEDGLRENARRLLARLDQDDGSIAGDLADIAYTLQVGREGMEYRAAFVVHGLADLRRRLDAFVAGDPDVDVCFRGVTHEATGVARLLGSDEDAAHTIAQWMAKRKLAPLAEAWAGGVEIDWRRLYGDDPPRRVSLPTYAFARERYWVPEPVSPSSLPLPSSTSSRVNSSAAPTTPADSTSAPDVDVLIHVPEWRQTSWPESDRASTVVASRERSRSLIFHFPEASGFEQIVAPDADERLFIEWGSRTARVDHDRWCVDIGDAQALSTVLGQVDTADRVYFVAPAGATLRAVPDLDALTRDHVQSAALWLRTVQALGDHETGRRAFDLFLITRDLFTPDGDVPPAAAGLVGLTQALAGERPRWRVRTVDVASEMLQEASTATAIAPMLLHEPADRLAAPVMYRSGQRHVSTIVPATLPRVERSRFRRDGVYVLIGGAGGLGRATSAYLHERYAAQLIWIGRRPMGPDVAAALEEIGTSETRPCYLSVDMADSASLTAAIGRIRTEYGRIDGVIHAAIAIDNGTIDRLTDARLTAVLDANARGLVAVDRLCRETGAEWLCVYSSVASYFADLGLADYRSTCTFKDAYVRALRRTAPYDVSCINWGYWATGLGSRDVVKTRMVDRGAVRPIDAAEGMEVLERTLAARAPQVLAFRLADQVRETLPIIAKPGDASTATARAPRMNEEHGVTRDRAQAYVRGLVSSTLKVPVHRLDGRAPLDRYGIDSVSIVEMTNTLEAALGQVSRTIFFEHQTIDQLVDHLLARHGDGLRGALSGGDPREHDRTDEIDARPVVVSPASTDVAPDEGLHDASRRDLASHSLATRRPATSRHERVAIVGVTGRYPRARDLSELWANLRDGLECISEIPAERWDWRAHFAADRQEARKAGKSYGKWGGFLEGFDEFDPLFFGIPPKEAASIDPQERLFLQCCWSLLEGAGFTRRRLARHRVGVFAGVTKTGFALYSTPAGGGHGFYPDTSFSSLANRVSYFFDFKGPSLPIDTMCSSSLTAIHEACAHIGRGECDLAIAGGVNLYLHPANYAGLSMRQMLSPDGRTRSFGEGANGFVPGEGVGAVLLRRLDDAERDGDIIYGLVAGTAINHGGRTNGYTVPNPTAQRELIREALLDAGVHARAVTCIEAHGTGTELGDPVEVTALTQAFRLDTDARGFCAIGSIKSNIGHLEAAAGIAGITKVLLQMDRRQLAPSINATAPNPNIDFRDTPFVLPRRAADWTRPTIEEDDASLEYPRIAGVSSFGAGGSNAHVILAEYIAPARSDAPAAALAGAGGRLIVPLSARTETALKDAVRALTRVFDRPTCFVPPQALTLDNIAYTLQTGREAMEHRVAFLAASVDELRAQLDRYLAGAASDSAWFAGCVDDGPGALGSLATNEDLSAALVRWAEKGKLAALAEVWARGVEVEWDRLWPGRPARRIALPTYVFAAERYWLPESARDLADAPSAKAPRVALLHPLVHRNASGFDGVSFTSTFSGTEFFLADHRINGRTLLAGVAQLELVRAAAALATGLDVHRLEQIVWLRPLVVDEAAAATIRVTLTRRGERVAVEATPSAVVTAGIDKASPDVGAVRPYARGEALVGMRAPAPRIDLDALRQGSRLLFDRDGCYAALAASGAAYGRGLRSIVTIHASPEAVLARLRVPDVVADSFTQFALHPSLLDGALQATIGLDAPGSDRDAGARALGVPFALRALEIHAPCEETMWAVIRPAHGGPSPSAQGELDIDLCTDEGVVAVRLEGLVLRAIDTAARTTSVPIASAETTETTETIESVASGTMRVCARWHSTPVPVATSSETRDDSKERRVVVLASTSEAFAEGLERMLGASCVRLSASDPSIDVRYLSMTTSLFRVLRDAMSSRTKQRLTVQLVVACGGAPEDELLVGLEGMLRTAEQESRSITAQLLIVDRTTPADVLSRRLDENRHAGSAAIDYRVNRRHERRWEECRDDGSSGGEPDAAMPWRAGATVLVTGGAGALGALVARDLACVRGVRVVLCGRSDPASCASTLHRLRERGGRVRYVRADVADPASVRTLIDDIARTEGGLAGIVHCAAITRDALIVKKDAADIAAVLAPKVAGLVQLDLATRDLPLERVILFSSTAGAFGNVGQADYAAANAFLDAYAAYRNRLAAAGLRSGQTLSIGWPYWQDGGMRIEPRLLERLERRSGQAPLTAAEGLDQWRRAIAAAADASDHHVVILHGSLPRIRERLGLDRARPSSIEPIPATRVDALPLARASAATSPDGGEAQLFHQQVEAWVTQICAAATGIPIDRFDARKPFAAFGVDSIVALDITSELEQALGPLPKTLFFQHQNIAEIAAYLLAQHRETLDTVLMPRVADAIAPARRDDVDAPRVDGLLQKRELPDDRRHLLDAIAGQDHRGPYVFEYWPLIFLSSTHDSFVHVVTTEDVLFATGYRGAPGGVHALLEELAAAGRQRGQHVCYWSSEPPDVRLAQDHAWVTLPIGVMQTIDDLASFTLDGAKMRRLRYVVSKFADARTCRTVEYTTSSSEVNEQIKAVVLEWCEHKKHVHSVEAFLAALEDGTWRGRHRIFLTYADDRLQNVILIVRLAADGWLMDQEYYRPDAPLGGLEYAICQIVAMLRGEARFLSLGVTWRSVEMSGGSDTAGAALLTTALGKETLVKRLFEAGERNFQFKNKFRPVNVTTSLYRPAASDPAVVMRFLSLFLEHGVSSHDIKALIDADRPAPAVAAAAIHVGDTATNGEPDLFDVTTVDAAAIRVDLMSDSWVYRREEAVRARCAALTSRVEADYPYDRTIADAFGYPSLHLSPLGRAAERLFFQTLAPQKRTIVSNLLFDTTIHHAVSHGMRIVELPDPRIFDRRSTELFRGGLDRDTLDARLAQIPRGDALVMLELCNNASGGYPISLAAIRDVARATTQAGATLVLDITRIVRNAILIQEHEPGQQQRGVWDIVRDIVSRADAIVGSLSKDFAIPFGGIIGARDDALLARVHRVARLDGGSIGEIERGVVGEAFRDLDAIEREVRVQMARTRRLADVFTGCGLPVLRPAAAHCLVLPVRELSEYGARKHPAHAFLRRLWEATGLRAGIHLTGAQRGTTLDDCVRVCVPLGLTDAQEREITRGIRGAFGPSPVPAPTSSHAASPAGEPPQVSVDRSPRTSAMAIVGMSGRFAAARDLDELWHILAQSRRTIGEVTRWDWRSLPGADRDDRLRWAGLLADVDSFDASAFGIAPREARSMDPRQRIMLDEVSRAIAHAGYTRAELAARVTGVFVAASAADPSSSVTRQSGDDALAMSFLGSIVGNRVSYHFGLTGPSESYDTGCSSTFVALQRAMQSIRAGECEQAVVGAVQILNPAGFLAVQQAGVLSATGEIRSFDAAADGYVRSEGAGAILIKPLDRAIADGDRVQAVIAGVAVTHGGTGLSLTTPSVRGMAEAMVRAYRQADVDVRTVQYIEAHGIASPLGDALEIEALTRGYAELMRARGPGSGAICRIGTLKPNLGHPEVASGMAALLKVVLALQHKRLLGVTGFERLNEKVSLDDGPFEIATDARAWPAPVDADGRPLPRRASLNSYAIGGVNAHVVIEECPAAAPDQTLHEAIDPRIVRAWCDVLGVSHVQPDDDFVRAGGHSLLAAQYVERLRLEGIECSQQDLLAERTLAGFARRVSARRVQVSRVDDGDAQVDREGEPFPLLPIQLELLGRGLRTGGGSGDAVPMVLRLPDRVDERVLVQALDAWHRQDVFRLRFTEEDGEWRQRYVPVASSIPIVNHDLAAADDRDGDAGERGDGSSGSEVTELIALSRRLEQGLDIAAGPTAAAAIVRRQGRPAYLLWVIDHLLIDNVTSQALVTNLEIAYRRLLAGDAFMFPRDRTAGQWAAHLQRQATSDAVVSTLPFWERHFDEAAPGPSSSDFQVEPIIGRVDGFTLDRLDRTLGDLGLSFEDLCLGLVLWAYRRVSGANRLLVRLIDNGRDLGGDAFDLWRAMGWFSVRYPALFRLDASGDRDGFLRDIARQRRAYAPRRAQYGMLRHLDPRTRAQVAAVENWDGSIAVNCLGDGGATRFASTSFAPAPVAARVLTGFARARQDSRREVRFLVSDAGLDVQAAFDPATVDRQMMTSLLDAIIAALADLLTVTRAVR